MVARSNFEIRIADPGDPIERPERVKSGPKLETHSPIDRIHPVWAITVCEQLIVAFVAAREKMNCSQEVSTKRRMGLGRKSLPAEPMLEHGQYINSNFQLKPRPTLKITGFLIWERGETKELVVLLRFCCQVQPHLSGTAEQTRFGPPFP